MKKYLLLSLISCLIIGSSFGQITYTSISFPQAGDILSISTAVDSSLTITPPSATATAWDFSQLVAINTNYDTIQAASTGGFYTQFSDADILQPLLGQVGVAYTDVTATQMERIGGGFEILGISFVNAFANTHVTQVVPLTYNDMASDVYAFRFSEHIDSVPFLRQLIDSLVSGLPFGLSPDSVRIAIDGDEDRVVDAWGTCAMADSTYDVLRQKVVTEFEVKFEVSVNVPFLGNQWVNVANFIQLPFPTRGTTVQYNFLSEGVKQPLVSLTLDSAETMVTNIEFLDTTINNPPNTIDVRYVEDEIAAQIYPNPAQQQVQIKMNAADLPTDGYNLLLVDMLGRVVLSTSNIQNENHVVDIRTIENGHYILILQNQVGKILKRATLEIHK
ncbi:T9SS type A sorting domain-containing protein [Aureispira sp. CCB-QB1]|uniref:T9SS type A sorting domain-containing protein n=1 Tax=Aureispira sp. CCB-QB1 TaxID=1313421 RepID=UPI000698E0BD|nr:T9SS type A sorting domain-containing protein [Aureispira sp. CCB-QB1]